jgi:hypothetical protein
MAHPIFRRGIAAHPLNGTPPRTIVERRTVIDWLQR